MASLCYYSSFNVIILVATLLLTNPIDCFGESNQEQEAEKTPKLLFVIGDSLYDPGNNQYFNATEKTRQSYSWPYGMNLNHKKATGRASDGFVIPDFIAFSLEITPLQPYLQSGADFAHGANFASAGSGCLEIHPGVMNLKMQLSNLKKVAKSLEQNLNKLKAKQVLKGSVYLIGLGANDYFEFNKNHPNASKSERIKYIHMVLGNLKMGLEEIYEMGGRKFAFQNVGPLGCLPMIKQMYPQLNWGCNNDLLIVARMHNRALSNVLKKLALKFTDFKYSIFDYYSALDERINNPSNHDFTEGKIACCGNGQFNGQDCGGNTAKDFYNLCKEPDDHVFFDGLHTSQRANSQLADLIWSGTPNITGPLNVKQLFELP
ncbi:hypothetical protein WN943_021971 [Citrus x changshan-huyou]